MANEENKIKEQPPITVKESKTIKEAKNAAVTPNFEIPEGMVSENLSWTGKMFFAGLAGYLATKVLQGAAQGSATRQFPFKIKGTPQQVQAVAQMVMSSKQFQDELRKPGATVDSVIRKLNLQNLTKEKFRLLTGKMWPLA